MDIDRMDIKLEPPTLHEIPLDEIPWEFAPLDEEVTFKRGLDYNGPDGIPETVTFSLDEEPNQHLVFERENPVTLSAETKANAVTELNRILDHLYDIRIEVNTLLLMIDKGG